MTLPSIGEATTTTVMAAHLVPCTSSHACQAMNAVQANRSQDHRVQPTCSHCSPLLSCLPASLAKMECQVPSGSCGMSAVL